MIKVQTRLNSSNIEGIGLFAAQNIKKGEVIWILDPRTTICYTITQWAALNRELPETALTAFKRFAYLNNGKWYLNLDDSRFMNHSTMPNTYYCNETNSCFAKFDINVGEELTCNYEEFDSSGEI